MPDLFINSKKIAVFCHIRPDGDALGSMLGLRLALLKTGKQVFCFCDDILPENLSFLTGFDAVSRDNITDTDFDTAVSLDCADISRLGKYKSFFLKAKNSICIDHHITNQGYAKINIIENRSSTCELCYQIIVENGFAIDNQIANCLYTGILTDTGNFSQSNTTPESHFVAAKLLETGVDAEYMSNIIFKSIGKDKLMLIKDGLTSMRFFENDRIALITITREILQKNNMQINDTEGIVDYAINLKTSHIGICMTEDKKDCYKISLRSKNNIDVSKAAGHFGGGGHKQASGLVCSGAYEEVVEKLVRICALELPEA